MGRKDPGEYIEHIGDYHDPGPWDDAHFAAKMEAANAEEITHLVVVQTMSFFAMTLIQAMLDKCEDPTDNELWQRRRAAALEAMKASLAAVTQELPVPREREGAPEPGAGAINPGK